MTRSILPPIGLTHHLGSSLARSSLSGRRVSLVMYPSAPANAAASRVGHDGDNALNGSPPETTRVRAGESSWQYSESSDVIGKEIA
jgi:hypothetical protein